MPSTSAMRTSAQMEVLQSSSAIEHGIEGGGPPISTEKFSPERSIQGLRWFAVCLAIFSCNLLYGLDNTIVADIQAAVVDTYGDITKLGWLGFGFPLGSVAIILPIGKAYAIFDTKWLYFFSLTMFAAGSALCGGAPSMNALIVGRVWAGAGGAGMYLGNLNLVQTLTTDKERSIYMSVIVLVYGVGAILGPVIGGSLADSAATWRWAFYLNLIIYAIMGPIYFFLLPSIQPQPDKNFLAKLKSLDWLGTLLNAGFYASFTINFAFGGSIWPWNDGRIIACFVAFGVILIAFIAQQYFSILTTTDNRIFPCQFLRSRTLVLLFICSASLGGALFVAIYYIPLYFQFVHGDNGTEAAVRLLPFICFYVVFVVLNGILMPRLGYYLPWYLFSGILTTVGGALMYTTSEETPSAKIYGYTILIGVGMAAYQAAYSVVPGKVAATQIAEAIQFINVAQQGSILVALTICNVVFQNVAFSDLVDILKPAGYSDQDIHAAVAGARSAVLTSAPRNLRKEALSVLVNAINDCYILVIISGALLVLCSMLMKWERLSMEIAAGG